ncbi:DNA-binding protein [Candidatus Parcubacteria bacterium]|nr:MAG: DNA-binding protein [Candidatus Parcubacteria bacterium]
MSTTKRFLTVREVARYLSISPAHVYNLCQRGELPSIRLGRSVRIPAEDLFALLEERRIDHHAQKTSS